MFPLIMLAIVLLVLLFAFPVIIINIAIINWLLDPIVKYTILAVVVFWALHKFKILQKLRGLI